MAKDATLKAKAKVLHGENKSQREIAGLCKISRALTQKWIDEWEADGYPKGFLQDKLDQKQAESRAAERQRLGLTEGRVDAKILKLMDAKKSVFFMGKSVAKVEDNTTQLGATTLAAEVLGMKKHTDGEALAAGIFTYYREHLAQKRGKR